MSQYSRLRIACVSWWAAGLADYWCVDTPGPHHYNKHLRHLTTKSGLAFRMPAAASAHHSMTQALQHHLSALHSLYHSQLKWMPALSRAPLPRTRPERCPLQCKPATPRLLDGMGACMLTIRHPPPSWPSACEHHQHVGSALFDNTKPATPTSCSPIPPRRS